MPDDTTGQARIEGIIKLEASDTIPKELNLTAYAFDKLGKLAGSGKVDEKGNFQLTIGQAEPKDLDIYIAPESDPQTVRQSHT